MNSAASVMNAFLQGTPVLHVSEPKKMLLKMTVINILKSMQGDEIILAF